MSTKGFWWGVPSSYPRTGIAAAIAAVMAMAAAFAPGLAGADAPDDWGWWSRGQTPATPPGVMPPPTIPAPPPQVVPENGMFVAMGPYSDVPDPTQPPPPIAPIAISAIRFTVDEGATATLSLGLAEGNDADGPAQAPHPPYLVDACVPDANAIAWDPPAGANGRWEDRPRPDCDSFSVPSEVTEDGQRLEWVLPPQFQVPEGVLDVILVPRGIPDPQDPAKTVAVPFTLAFDPPDDVSLLVEPGEEDGSGEEDTEGDLELFGSDEFADDDLALGDDFGAEDFGEFGDFAADGGNGAAVGRTGGSRQNRFQPAARLPAIDDRVERVMAVSVLLALVVALWWIAGQPVRPPRLLGSVGSGAPVVTAVAGARRGGVGRFARARSGRPPGLS